MIPGSSTIFPSGPGVPQIHIPQSTLLATALAFLTSAVVADEFAPAPAGTFSIAVIPDTQRYQTDPEDQSISNPVFESYVDWIAANLTNQRIVFVTHVGDIVNLNNDDQWAVARKIMDQLHGRVPYELSVGNHDMIGSGDSSLFQKYFPASRFESFDWYGGCYQSDIQPPAISGNNANSFQLFSAEGLEFVILHLECNAPDDVLAWADDILERHSDRRAIVTSHMGLGPRDKPKTPEDFFDLPKGRMTWKKCHGDRGNSPEQMWNKCFRKHENLFMLLCGDQSRTQAMRIESKGDHGNTIHELLSDYGSSGFRLMRFVPGKDKIEIRSWNPLKNEFCRGTKLVPEAGQHQFELEYEMSLVPAN